MAFEALPFPGLNFPGCPFPGPDFVRNAELMGDFPLTLPKKGKGKNATVEPVTFGPVLVDLYRRALYDPGFSLSIAVKQGFRIGSTLPGHHWLGRPATGPRPSRVMVVGKWPTDEEVAARRLLSGPAGSLLRQELEYLNVGSQKIADWYVTCFVKHPNLDPAGKSVPSGWKKNWLPTLFHELLLVRPDWILCLGAEAAEALLGEKVAVRDAVGEVTNCTIAAFGDHPEKEAKLMTVYSPSFVLNDPPGIHLFRESLNRFVECLEDRPTAPAADRDWRIVYDRNELDRIVDMVMQRAVNDPHGPILVFDSEWEGQWSTQEGSWLRTIQFSDRAGFACCVVLRHEGGDEAFLPSPEDAIEPLRRLLRPTDTWKPRICGHHLRADIPWIEDRFDRECAHWMRHGYRPAATPERMRFEGGLDTMLLAHAIRETGFAEGFKLEYVCQSLLGVRPWNRELDTWVDKDCKERKVKRKSLTGYGHVPAEVLHPYACGDVDYPRELIDLMIAPGGLLDSDEYKQASWRAAWSSSISSLCFLEMEQTGISFDKELATELTEIYSTATKTLLHEIRTETRWPDFNPASQFDCRELLFGEDLSGRKNGNYRPDDALSLYLTPVCNTAKPPVNWDKIVAKKAEALNTPSTGKETLGILRSAHPLVDKLRRYRFLAQVGRTILRPPVKVENADTDEDDEVFDAGLAGWSDSIDASGDGDEYRFDGGLISFVRETGRIHTSLRPTTETGRVRSSNPNLTNISKRREDDYKKILGKEYKLPMRAMLVRSKDGDDYDPWVLVDFDLRGAELFIAGVQAGDVNLIDHCQRNSLKKSDPRFYDTHSNIAVNAFRLDCAPTSDGLESIGKLALRIAAKTLAFGVIYGRGDEAIARAVKEEGVTVTMAQVAELREYFFSLYSSLKSYLDGAMSRVDHEGFLRNAYGRSRRFASTENQATLAKLKREAGNYGIQSCVADVVHRWMSLLYDYPGRVDRNGNKSFRFLLQIHDALLCECRVSALEWFVEAIESTLASIPIYACDFDGNRIPGSKPYTMGTEISVHTRWGVKLTRAEADELGIPDRFVP